MQFTAILTGLVTLVFYLAELLLSEVQRLDWKFVSLASVLSSSKVPCYGSVKLRTNKMKEISSAGAILLTKVLCC